MEADKPQTKEFGLSQAEVIAIQNNNAIANQIMSSFISYLAVERFGYSVTEHTNFKIDNGRLFIWEEQPNALATGDSQLETA